MTISVITICLNSERYIAQTIESVISQTYAEKEYIMVDGGSTDGTLDIIRKYEDRIDCLISEPDHGIADAMNKGLDLSSGDFVIFLHSDDYFVDSNVLDKAAGHLSNDAEIFLFDIFFEKNGKKVLKTPRGFNWWLNIKNGVFHQSTICSRALFDKIGFFDTSYKIAMDYDFFLRAYRKGVCTKKIHIPLSVMRLVGISSQTDRNSLRARFSEEKRVHEKNCQNRVAKIFYSMFWTCYPFYRFLKDSVSKGSKGQQ